MDFLRRIKGANPLNEVALSGSVLGVGLIGLFCLRRQFIPASMGAVSYFLTAMGICATTVSVLRKHRRNVRDEISKENSDQEQEVLNALESAIMNTLSAQALDKEMEVKKLQQGWEAQSKRIGEYLSQCHIEGMTKTTTSSESELRQTETTDFNSLRRKADLTDRVGPGTSGFLSKDCEQIPETRGEATVSAEQSLSTTKYYSSTKEIPSELKEDPLALQLQYERDLSHLMELLRERAQNVAEEEPREKLDGKREDESDIAEQNDM